MFAISPFAAWVEIGSPVNLRAPAYKILQTPYPLGSRFIRESKLQPTLYSVNSDFVSVCIINFFRRHRPFRKTAASAVSLSGHVFNAFRAGQTARFFKTDLCTTQVAHFDYCVLSRLYSAAHCASKSATRASWIFLSISGAFPPTALPSTVLTGMQKEPVE